MQNRYLAPEDYETVPWKNGGGVSTTIAGERFPGNPPGDWSGVKWQLGRTRIVVPAPFSDLNGFERLQIVIGGSGLVLETPNGEIDLREPFRPARYDGGTLIVSRLENGPVEVLNLIARRDHWRIALICPLLGELNTLPPCLHVVHAPNEPAKLHIVSSTSLEKECHLPAGHSLIIEGAGKLMAIAGRIAIASIGKR